MADYAALIPVNVITGFLGSGKTTLLGRLLEFPELGDAAVLINEFGEVGLDHHLVRRVDETIVQLQSGCLCCTIRGDIQETLRELFSRRERGEIPPFARVIVETTGLADPAPIAYTLLAEPVIQHHFRLGNIVTVVDAVNGMGQLERFDESVKQAALADRLVLSKTDIAGNALVSALRESLRALNPSAPVLDANRDIIDPAHLFRQDSYDAEGKSREVAHWMDGQAQPAGPHPTHRHARTGGEIKTFSLILDEPLDWTAFGFWMTMFLHRHGENALRIKGLLNVKGLPTPVLINGVQHIVHPPSHLTAWPDGDRRSRIIFIVRGLDPGQVEASLVAFNRLANPASAADSAMGK